MKGAILEFLDRKPEAKKFFHEASQVYFSLGMKEAASDILRHSNQISSDIFPPMQQPMVSETEEESSDEEPSGGHNSSILYAVLGGALTALSAFALYKARSQ